MYSFGDFYSFNEPEPEGRPAQQARYPKPFQPTLWLPGRQATALTREPRLMVPGLAPLGPCKPNSTLIRSEYFSWVLMGQKTHYINGRKGASAKTANTVSSVGKCGGGTGNISGAHAGRTLSPFSALLVISNDGVGGTSSVSFLGDSTDGYRIQRSQGIPGLTIAFYAAAASYMHYPIFQPGHTLCTSIVIDGSGFARFRSLNLTTRTLYSTTSAIATPGAMGAGDFYAGWDVTWPIFWFCEFSAWSLAQQLEYLRNPFLLCVPD